MQKITIAGFTVRIKPDNQSFCVSVYKGSEKMPFTGTIFGNKLEAEQWAVKKIHEQITKTT
jgi:hypothetical protein